GHGRSLPAVVLGSPLRALSEGQSPGSWFRQDPLGATPCHYCCTPRPQPPARLSLDAVHQAAGEATMSGRVDAVLEVLRRVLVEPIGRLGLALGAGGQKLGTALMRLRW